MRKPVDRIPPKIVRIAPAKQRRLDRLLEKNSEGTLSTKEMGVLRKLVDEAEQLMVENAKRLAEFARPSGNGLPSNAVPVTVWVSPSAPGR